MVKGFAHIGVLQAFEDQGLQPAALAGTSAGAIAAALYAFGTSPEDMYGVAKKLNWFTLARPALSNLGLVTNEALRDLVKEFFGNPDIEDAELPLAIIATDIATGEEVVLRHGNLASALMASTCLPGIFKPVRHHGRLLVDGGLVDNIPVDVLRKMGMKCVIGVNVTPFTENRSPRNAADVILNAYDITTNAVAEAKAREVDYMITPAVAAYSRFDFKKLNALYTAGYHAGQKAVPRIEALLKKSQPWYRRLGGGFTR